MTAFRLALVAVLGGAVALTVLARPTDPAAPAFGQAHDVLATTTSRKLVVGPDHPPFTLHRVTLTSRCPTLAIEWASTNVEPTTPDATAVIELVLDGRVVQRARFGSGAGVYEDGPARLSWRGAAPPGEHDIEVRLVGGGITTAWGVPYTDPSHIGLDTLLAQDDPPAGARPATCTA